MTTHQRILALLIRARRGDYVETVDLGRVRVPPGWLPLFSFQGKDVGGSAANMRLWELKAPYNYVKGSKGIPVEKDTFHYTDAHGQDHHLPIYRLGIEPADIDRFLNLETCSVNLPAIRAAGYELIQSEDSGVSPAPCMKLIKRSPRPAQTSIFAGAQ